MPAAAVQGSISSNVAGVNVATSSERGQVPANSVDLDVPAFSFQSGNWPAARNFAKPSSTDATRRDVSTLRFQEGRAANIPCGDIAGACNDFQVVIARYEDLELHPKLRIGIVLGLGKERAGNFHPARRSTSPQRIPIE